MNRRSISPFYKFATNPQRPCNIPSLEWSPWSVLSRHSAFSASPRRMRNWKMRGTYNVLARLLIGCLPLEAVFVPSARAEFIVPTGGTRALVPAVTPRQLPAISISPQVSRPVQPVVVTPVQSPGTGLAVPVTRVQPAAPPLTTVIPTLPVRTPVTTAPTIPIQTPVTVIPTMPVRTPVTTVVPTLPVQTPVTTALPTLPVRTPVTTVTMPVQTPVTTVAPTVPVRTPVTTVLPIVPAQTPVTTVISTPGVQSPVTTIITAPALGTPGATPGAGSGNTSGQPPMMTYQPPPLPAGTNQPPAN